MDLTKPYELEACVLLIIAIIFTIGLVGLLIVASRKESHFRYERNGIIAAAPNILFPYISNFKNGHLWSPYEKADLNMKKTFGGTDGQIGSTLEFAGNNKVGSGKLEIINMIPNELVEIKLTMLKPFRAESLVQYRLTPEPVGTKFSWVMTGDNGFIGKIMVTLIDCEKMVAGQFTEGINNLKSVVENLPSNGTTQREF